MKKFEVGDRVRVVEVVSEDSDSGIEQGSIGTVVRVLMDYDSCRVEFDGYLYPNINNNFHKDGSYYMYNSQLELLGSVDPNIQEGVSAITQIRDELLANGFSTSQAFELTKIFINKSLDI